MVILAAAEFSIGSTKNRLKVYRPGQLLFGCDMIPPIKHKVDWELICQWNQTQINKDNIQKNRNQVDHDYKVGDKDMLNNHDSCKNVTPYIGPFLITRYFTNGMVNL